MSDTLLSERMEHSEESKAVVGWPFLEDVSEMLAIVSAIPDGISLASFPSHAEGPECWCRPKVTFSADMMIVRHKDLSQGDFDS